MKYYNTVILYYNLMGPLSYVLSVVDRNVDMLCIYIFVCVCVCVCVCVHLCMCGVAVRDKLEPEKDRLG